MRIIKSFELFFFFIYEVVRANIQVAILVFTSKDKITPAIVEMPLTVTKDYQILALSSMITLTPGTLSLAVSDDRKSLFVYVLQTSDPEQTITEIKQGFERRLLEIFE